MPPEVPGEAIEVPDAARGAQAGGGTKLDLSKGRWLINPGSVGQPRDGDPRAAWLELDTDSWEATYHRVEYDDRPRRRGDHARPTCPSTWPAPVRGAVSADGADRPDRGMPALDSPRCRG